MTGPRRAASSPSAAQAELGDEAALQLARLSESLLQDVPLELVQVIRIDAVGGLRRAASTNGRAPCFLRSMVWGNSRERS